MLSLSSNDDRFDAGELRVRTTLNIDDELLEKAMGLTGISERTAVVRAGLQALVERESARRLARLGGTQPQLKPVPRRRSS
ncbi:MAG: type II toxin-antitoxin system VapB family antitoxin [Halioglobus sp.]